MPAECILKEIDILLKIICPSGLVRHWRRFPTIGLIVVYKSGVPVAGYLELVILLRDTIIIGEDDIELYVIGRM